MGNYPVSSRQLDDLNNRFTYHAPKEGQAERYEDLRKTGGQLALKILTETPGCREQSLALTHCEEAIFWANAAIARNDKPPAQPGVVTVVETLPPAEEKP